MDQHAVEMLGNPRMGFGDTIGAWRHQHVADRGEDQRFGVGGLRCGDQREEFLR